uniref:Uncharacterized protein ycf23 n=1 Tax=Yamadaella caenomyce TaxID=259029 RepID=A0A1G4NYQ6_9FLOR|nr:Hypothetical protein ycf23 [Yamadaella caenomyce]SCW23754.1 Hypothetical protein ycf23 [Yamadaella caenomyce]
MPLNTYVQEAFDQKTVLKTIIGIDKLRVQDVVSKAQAAEIGGATYVDIAANTSLVHAVRSVTSIPICVSSICIEELMTCYDNGVDMLEIGNFDIFYSGGIRLLPEHIIKITSTLRLYADQASICVTIPCYLGLREQVHLAQHVEKLGVDIIQTEGYVSKYSADKNVYHPVIKASSTLASTLALRNCIKLPVITSSGINSLTAPMAISSGASGVGISSAFNGFNANIDLIEEVNEVVYSIQTNKTYNQKLKSCELVKDPLQVSSKV